MKNKKSIVVILLFILVMNFLQAIFQPLLLDEAYYYYYANNLSFGYFDHPPLTAWLIKLGSFLGATEIGVRLSSVFLSALSFGLLIKATRGTENITPDLKTVLLLLCLPFVHTLYLAIPDVGLVFFTIAFYLVFESYLRKDSLQKALLLGIISAGLMYAKYHGALTVFLALIVNRQLFRRKSLWLAFALFVVLLMPHLIWLSENKWITVQFQLFGRGSSGFSLMNIVEYVFAFGFVTLGLLSILLLFPENIKRFSRLFHKNTYNRTLGLTLVGFFLFFLVFAFKGPIETNWLFSAAIPASILFFRANIWDDLKGKVVVYSSIGLFVVMRFVLMTSLLPDVGYLFHFTGYEKWACDIQKRAEGRQVFFENSYQMAAMYTFQTGDFSYSLNTLGNRSNQYDLTCFNAIVEPEEVFIVSEWLPWENPVDTLDHEKGKYKIQIVEGLTFLNNIDLELRQLKKHDDRYEVSFDLIQNCGSSLVELNNTERLKVMLELYRKGENPIRIELVKEEYIVSESHFELRILFPENVDSFEVGFAVDSGPVSDNTYKIELPD